MKIQPYFCHGTDRLWICVAQLVEQRHGCEFDSHGGPVQKCITTISHSG